MTRPLHQLFNPIDTDTTSTGAQLAHWNLVEQLPQAAVPKKFNYDPASGFSADNPSFLAAALSAPLVAFDNEELRKLCGPEGYFTDGRTVWVDGSALLRRAAGINHRESSGEELLKWTREMFLSASEAALGLPTSSGVPTQMLREAIARTPIAQNPQWEAVLGYDLPFNPLELALGAAQQIKFYESDEAMPSPRWHAVREQAAANPAPLLSTIPDEVSLAAPAFAFAKLLDTHQQLGERYAEGGQARREAASAAVEVLGGLNGQARATVGALLVVSALGQQLPDTGPFCDVPRGTQGGISMEQKITLSNAIVEVPTCTDVDREAVISALSASMMYAATKLEHPNLTIERLRLASTPQEKAEYALELANTQGVSPEAATAIVGVLQQLPVGDVTRALTLITTPTLEALGLVSAAEVEQLKASGPGWGKIKDAAVANLQKMKAPAAPRPRSP